MVVSAGQSQTSFCTVCNCFIDTECVCLTGLPVLQICLLLKMYETSWIWILAGAFQCGVCMLSPCMWVTSGCNIWTCIYFSILSIKLSVYPFNKSVRDGCVSPVMARFQPDCLHRGRWRTRVLSLRSKRRTRTSPSPKDCLEWLELMQPGSTLDPQTPTGSHRGGWSVCIILKKKILKIAGRPAMIFMRL